MPSLRAFALSLVGDRVKADDLVHDTIVRALQKSDCFQHGTNLQAWGFTLLRNLFYSDYRIRKREVEDVDGLYAAKLSTLPEQPGQHIGRRATSSVALVSRSVLDRGL